MVRVLASSAVEWYNGKGARLECGTVVQLLGCSPRVR